MARGQRLSERIPSEGPEVFYRDDFKTMLEHHIPLLATHVNAVVRPIEPATAVQFASDFYGVLIYLGIPTQYHWTILRVNGLTSPYSYKEEMTQIVVPPLDEIDQLQQIWSSNNQLSMG
jgi:hypothetical protein